MKTQRRKQYLQEMGIVLWRPHTTLPGAKPSALLRRKLVESTAAQQGVERPGKQRLQSAASILAEHSIPSRSHQASAPAVQLGQTTQTGPSTQTRGVQSKSAPADVAGEALASLFIAECPGELLIIDSSAESREHQQLIRNLMFAVTNVPPGQYRFTPVNGQQLASAQASLSELTFGVVERATMQNKTRRLLLLGDAAIELFQGAVDVKGAQTLQGFSADITVATSHGSAALLNKPELKRETWAHVQCLCKQ